MPPPSSTAATSQSDLHTAAHTSETPLTLFSCLSLLFALMHDGALPAFLCLCNSLHPFEHYGLFQHIPQGQSVHTHLYKAALTLLSAHCGAARHNLVQFLLNYIQPKISPRVNVRWSCGIMLHFIQYLVFHFFLNWFSFCWNGMAKNKFKCKPLGCYLWREVGLAVQLDSWKISVTFIGVTFVKRAGEAKDPTNDVLLFRKFNHTDGQTTFKAEKFKFSFLLQENLKWNKFVINDPYFVHSSIN